MRLRAALRRAQPASAEFQQLLQEAGARMGVKSPLRLRVSEENAGPALCGLIRPCVLIPKSVLASLSPAQLRTVFLHEMAHLKRNDLPLNLVQTVLQVLYFYNPLLWLANARIRKLREEAVDEAVLVATAGEPEIYPTALLNVARLTQSSGPIAFQGIGIIESRSSLGGRIRRMVELPIPRSARVGVVWTVAVLALGACLLPMATPAQNEPANPPPMVSAADARRFLDKVPLADPRFQVEIQAITNRLVNSADLLLPVLLEAIAKPLPEKVPANLRRERARDYWALSLIGPKAAPAIPHLIRGLEEDSDDTYQGLNYITPSVAWYAAEALGAIGRPASNAVAALVDSAHFGNAKALTALARIAPESAEVENLIFSKVTAQGSFLRNGHLLRAEAMNAIELLAPTSKRAYEFLLRGIEDEDPAIRSASVRILRSGNLPGGKMALKEALSGDLEKRVRVAASLAPHARQDEAIYNILVEGLGTPSLRQEALQGLRWFPERCVSLIPQLLGYLKADDYRVTLETLRLFSMIPSQRSSEILKAVLPLRADSYPEIAEAVTRVIGRNGLLTPEVAALLKSDIREGDLLRKNLAIHQVAVLNCVECLPDVLEVFRSDEQQSEAALATLAHFPDAARPLIPELIRLYEAGERNAESVAAALGRLGTNAASVVPSMRLRLATNDVTDPRGNLNNTVQAIGKLGPAARAAIPEIERWLESPHRGTRSNAAVSLWRLDGRLDVLSLFEEAFLAALKEDAAYAVHPVFPLRIMKEMGPQAMPLRNYVVPLTTSDQSMVREAAQEALAAIDGPNIPAKR